MSLDNTTVVDAMGLETGTEHAVLTIADSWEWSDDPAHLLALQAKLNAYFEFIESGQIWEAYPAAKNRQLVIDVITRFPPTISGVLFLEKAKTAAAELNVIVTHRTLPGPAEVQ